MCGELGELLLTVTQAFDVRREACLFVGVDQDGVQPRIRSRRLEPGGKGVEELAQGRLDFDSDDRVVRAGHADVREERRPLWKNALVRGLDVRVSAHHRRHLALL